MLAHRRALYVFEREFRVSIYSASLSEADVHERLLTNPEPEAETLFDDSEVPDEPIQAVEGKLASS